MDPTSPCNHGRESYITKIPHDVFCHIVLDTISGSRHPPNPRDLHSLSQLPCVSRLFYNHLSFTKNPSFYAKVFRLMFDIGAVEKRLGCRYTIPHVLSLELQKRTKVLQRIKAATTRDGITLDDHTAIFFMLLDNEGKNMQQLQYAHVARFLNLGITRVLADSNGRPSQSLLHSDVLLWPLVWMTGSLRFIIQRNPRLREDMLDLLRPFLLQVRQITSHETLARDDQIIPVPFNHHGLTLTFTPILTPFARLCTTELFHIVDPTSTTDTIESRSYASEWRQCTDADSLERCGNTVGAFEGEWKGSFFIATTIIGDSGSVRQATCEVVTQCRLREYHAVAVKDTLEWDDEGDALSRAWFPTGMRWYEAGDALMIYDPTKLRSLQYSRCIPEASTPFAVQDTIIVGTTPPAGTYTLHGRVRHADGLIVLIRTPTDPTHSFLGTWVFYGRVHGATHFVGEWRGTAPEAEAGVAVKGWFTWTKAVYQG